MVKVKNEYRKNEKIKIEKAKRKKIEKQKEKGKGKKKTINSFQSLHKIAFNPFIKFSFRL